MALIKNINGSGGLVGADSHEIDAVRRGVPVSQARIAEPATGPLSSGEKQKTAASAAVAKQSAPAPANPTSPFKS